MAETYILIAGGGVRGSFSAACIANLQKKNSDLAQSQVIAGVSVGSIIGAALATGANLGDLIETLRASDVVEQHSAVTNMFRTLQMYRGKRESLFSTKMLEDILRTFIADRQIIVDEYTAVAGDALKLKQVEFTRKRGEFVALPEVLASCAILGAYPAVELEQPGNPPTWFIDGGFSNAFPMKKAKEFINSDVATRMCMFATKPWLARVPPIEIDQYSVKNTTLLLFREYWYALTKLDHNQLFKLLNIPTEMVLDGPFAAVYTQQGQRWVVDTIVSPRTTAYTAPTQQTKVIYFCAPLGQDYKVYEGMNLSQSHQEREERMVLTLEYGEKAAEDLVRMQMIIEGKKQTVQLQSQPLNLLF